MLWADDEEREAPVYSPKIDPTLRYGTKGRTLEGDGNIIQPRTEEYHQEEPAPNKDNPKEKTYSDSEGWHPKSKYRVTKWIRVSDSSYKLVIESRDGRKMKDVNGRSDKGITLRKPIQFTVPDWVTEVHVDKKVNYEILDGGELRELDLFTENGRTFRRAYPGDEVLLVNGDGLTTWVRK